MRILVADQNALLLAAVASTFGRHCVVVTATRREDCLEHLAGERFDVVVACEKLRDYTGLELLSEVETLSPHTLRIFAAPPAHLSRLGSRLDHFGLLGTLSYPIEARKLLVALKVARTKRPVRPKVRHVVLESEWDTGERLGILERELEVAPADPPVLAAAPDASQSPAAEPDDIPFIEFLEETSVSQVQRIRAIPVAEVPLEVSFDENPNRAAATAARAADVKPAQKPIASAPTVAHAAPVKSAQTPIAPPPTSARAAEVKPAPRPTASSSTAMPTPHVKSPPMPQAVPPIAAHVPNGALPPAPLPLPPTDAESAANDPAFVAGPTDTPPARSGAKSATTASTGKPAEKAAAAKRPASHGPQPRQQAVPTAAQREAFQRARARRNAGHMGLPDQIDTHASPRVNDPAGTTPSVFRPHWHGTHTLSDLAGLATTKRPLAQARSKFQPKRQVFVVGSGVAAVLLASVLAFQLTRSHAPTSHNRRAAAAQLFAPPNTNLVAENNAPEAPAQVFGPPPGQPEPAATPSSASNGPQPQVFDPNTAPEDPPPPPALEHPGPMEPPSMAHNEVQRGMPPPAVVD